MEALDVGSRHRIQTLQETYGKDPQPHLSKVWVITEEAFDRFQLLLIATYAAVIRLGSVPDPSQRPSLAVPRDN